MPAEFSSFKKRQLTFEARFDEAYILWDRTGAIWTSLQPMFKTMKLGEVQPNRGLFHADERYSIHVALQRMSITDFSPDSSWEKSFEVIEGFFEIVAASLELRVLTRIGTRFQYAIETKTIEDARKRAIDYGWAISPGKLFQIEPKSVAHTLKLEVDDGEVGYTGQIYAIDRNVEIEPPPNAVALGLTLEKRSVTELVIDLDFMTKKPMPVESFKVTPWLLGWQSAINRDANTFLNLGRQR